MSAATGTVVAMDWSTIANVSTAVGVIVALAAVVSSLILTLRSERLTRSGQELQRAQADAAAARSEAAAALTEEYTRRLVAALEAMAESGMGTGPHRMPLGVVWSLRHHGGDTYLLQNEGNIRAEQIEVSSHESLPLIWPQPVREALGPGEALTFMAALTLGTRDSTITVSWSEDGSPEKTWRYPLPPRPTRR